MRITQGYQMPSLDSIVFFPFDDHAFPLQHGVRLQLNGFTNRPSRVVVGLGEPGTSDCCSVAYYGTVRKVGDEFWMWYLGNGGRDEGWFDGTRRWEGWHERVHLAKSKDGKNWEKPNLGVMEYNGSKKNNLVDLTGGDHITAAVVFYEPDDPDPKRRFKIAFEAYKYRARLSVAYSEDGVRWVENPNNPVGPPFEQTGGTRFNGVYYVSGGSGWHWTPKSVAGLGTTRLGVTAMSYDFDHWTQATCLGLRRDPLPPKPTYYGGNAGPQVHLGSALWNRGNVLIGFYGMWDGHPSDDRRLVCMDLGFVVSNDALHFREPIPDFPIVRAMEIGYLHAPNPPTVRFPALVQGQGFENIGDETLFWYAPWPEGDSDGVRLATWPRDRLGSLQCLTEREAPGEAPHAITAPVDPEGKPIRLSANVSGLSEHAEFRVAVLDERFRELPGYAAAECTGLRESGFAQPVTWNGRDTIDADVPIRLRVEFGGIRPEDVRIHALYLE